MIMGPRKTTTIKLSDAELTAQIAAAAAAKLQSETPADGEMPRDAHHKSHGCFRASFTVLGNLPVKLRVGLFAKPFTYEAWVRSSNGSPSSGPDGRPDLRGFAVKVMGVVGTKCLEDELDAMTQDFVTCNYPAFFVRTTEDYLAFFNGISGGLKGLATQFFFPSLNPFKWRLLELWNFGAAALSSGSSLAEIRYWSQTPYKFGDRVAKYSVRPNSCPTYEPVAKDSPNRWRETWVRQLKNGDIVMDFMVQLQTNGLDMPIEDSRIRWSERQSPFIKIAEIRIPAQEFDTGERRAWDENLSFTPWHALLVHMPLGAINKTRRIVYQTISKLRHTFNRAPRKEPTPADSEDRG